jgi:hypothetical protein
LKHIADSLNTFIACFYRNLKKRHQSPLIKGEDKLISHRKQTA